MVTRRTLLKQGGCAALAGAVPLALRVPRAAAATTTFDYYISTTGSDANPGTLASPWSITALNAHRSVYAGKRVGIIAGIYNVYPLNQKAVWNGPALAVNGGTSGSPTYVASCDTNGNYFPRAATLTALNPIGALFPSVEASIIGQGYAANGNYSTPVPSLGYVTLDGLVITGSYQTGVSFWYNITSENGGIPGCVVQNCEIFDIGGVVNDNVAGVYLQGCSGALVHNCKIHDIVALGGNEIDVAGIFSYYCHSNVYEHCTIYNCIQAVRDKYFPNGNATLRYNYFEIGGATSSAQGAICDATGGNAGDVYTIHHNILKVFAAGVDLWYGATWFVPIKTGYAIYNNTFVFGGGSPGLLLGTAGSGVSAASVITHYNNIYAVSGTPNPGYGIVVMTNTIALSDYNLYSSLVASGTALKLAGSTSNPYSPTASYNLSGWQKALSVDSHSAALDPVFASPGILSPGGYKLALGTAGSATSATPGRTTGTTNGTVCDMGAWGYDPALGGRPLQIGCNFGPIPNPPVVTVS